MATTEIGHAASRSYFDQDGNLHMNGSSIYLDESGNALSPTEASYFDAVTAGTATASKGVLLDSSTGIHGILFITVGGAQPTNPQAMAAFIGQTITATANQSYHRVQNLHTGGAVTVPTGTAPVVSSLNIHEPNITATGTVTDACTLRIVDAPTEGSANWALWVDAGTSRFDGGLNFAAAAEVFTIIANTAVALTVSDGTTNILGIDTRNTIVNVHGVTVTGPAVTVASATAAHINSSLNIAAKTITYTGGTGVTSSLGAMLNVGVATWTDTSMMTITTASAVHINAIAAAGGMLTITNSYMISTSVSGCFLTNAGVWTDMACFADGKKNIVAASMDAIGGVINRLVPQSWQYRDDVHGNDHGRNRIGIVYDDLPDELRAPGQETAVSTGLLSSFALAAIRYLSDRIAALEAKLEGAKT